MTWWIDHAINMDAPSLGGLLLLATGGQEKAEAH
jgi:hypothetical protein